MAGSEERKYVDTLTEIFGQLTPGELVVKHASEELRDGRSAN